MIRKCLIDPLSASCLRFEWIIFIGTASCGMGSIYMRGSFLLKSSALTDLFAAYSVHVYGSKYDYYHSETFESIASAPFI
jgi:hypothetical protein